MNKFNNSDLQMIIDSDQLSNLDMGLIVGGAGSLLIDCNCGIVNSNQDGGACSCGISNTNDVVVVQKPTTK